MRAKALGVQMSRQQERFSQGQGHSAAAAAAREGEGSWLFGESQEYEYEKATGDFLGPWGEVPDLEPAVSHSMTSPVVHELLCQVFFFF
jgi:hypothetical protein